MPHKGQRWCPTAIRPYHGQLMAAFLVMIALALCLLYISRPADPRPMSVKSDSFLQSPADSQGLDHLPPAKQQEHQFSNTLARSSVALSVVNDHAKPAVNTERTVKLFDLGWQGFDVACFNTIPLNSELSDSASRSGQVEIRYVICCNVGGVGPPTSCRNASKPMVIPRQNAEAVSQAGEHTIRLSAINAEQDFVFMTGASENHYQESLALVRGIQTRFPKRKIIYCDVGLKAEQAAEVKRFCDVVYKQLDFSKYPPHVRKLSTYAFKPLCIMETLAEYPLLWWVDSSIRFTGDGLSNGLAMLEPRHGLVMFHDPGHSVWSTTYPQTFEYIATDEPGLQKTVTCTGASFIIANTPEIFSTFLYWLYVCALDERCIAPVDHPERCKQQGPTVFADCHRFDQSVMTILAANFWGFGSDSYRFRHRYFHLERWPDGVDNVLRC